MTEYDYSPEAYERLRDRNENISRWVQRTKQHEAPNPFLPLPGEQRTSSFYDTPSPPSPPRASRSAAPYGNTNYLRQAPSRSYSLPPSMVARSQATATQTPYALQQPQQQYAMYGNSTYFSYPGSHQTSPLVSPPAPTQYSYSQPLAPSNGTRTIMSNGQQYYQPATNQPVIVPIHGGAAGYVVVPAAGQKIQIVPNTQYAPVMTVKSDNSQSFLGSLKSGKKSKKKSRSSRRDSY